jgi:hypothetical protein
MLKYCTVVLYDIIPINVLFVVTLTPVKCVVRMYDSPCVHACKDTLCGVKKTNRRSTLQNEFSRV